jgi:hypothetical protein
MVCRSCGTDIADKAIVCYRCGAPTASPAGLEGKGGRRAPGPTPGLNWRAVPVMLGLIAVAAWLVPQTPAHSAARWGAWAVLVVVTAVAVLALRRGQGLRR